MSLSVAVEARLGERAFALAFESDAAVTALFGASGCGKTSTLDMIAGLRRPDAGRIVVDGETLFDSAAGVNLQPEARRIGTVFQDARLFPHLSVRRNLLYGARVPAEMPALAAELGIAGLLDRWPRHLSGGETRRVAIGRALLSKPRLLLLDEPLAHLDRARADGILELIRGLAAAARVPILYVSHDLRELTALNARIIDMNI
ncbi:ATP-binding cassette domain-containing protein [Sandaracinobacteroides saxicola]|uniref:ATP-binding cassette domain-containing protein n=2 Tax=Sandaracinobacteroides saxicola TaxID=2759707 RepID=A0A7G5IMQ6_9SPHN|nr:ATP-binding cassette domain-containing protein [Sandaracinobacteroides saxicola]